MAKLSKEEAVKKIEEGDGDFQVFADTEYDEFLNNLKDTEVFKNQIDGRVSEMHQQYDNDFFAVTGKRKAQDEKTYDFIKREVKTMQDHIADLEEKKSELEKAVNDKSGSQALELLRGELDSMKKKYQTFKDDADQRYKDLEQQGEKMRIMHEFDKSLTGMKFKDATIIPEDVRNAMISNAKMELVNSAKFVDGKLAFLDSEGNIMRDENLNVLAPKDILTEKLKSIIDPGRKQTGVDIEELEIENEDGKVTVNMTIPDSVKTNVQLSEYLMQSGLKRDSDEYRAAYAKYRDKLQKVT